jgi:4-carboxymuconolactone decarboxylase
VSDDDLREALLHVALYAGIPSANTAFATAKRVLAERSTSAADGGR